MVVFLHEGKVGFLMAVSSRLLICKKYLGIYLSTRLTFSYTFHPADLAKKGICAIVKLLWSVGERSPSALFLFFTNYLTARYSLF